MSDSDPSSRESEDGGLGIFCTAVAEDLLQLASLHRAEPTRDLLLRLREVGFPDGLGLELQTTQGRTALALMKHGLSALPDDLSSTVVDLLAVDYADIYLTYAFRASPCESVWLDEDQLAYQNPMFQVREFYRRHNLGAENWRRQPEDHLALQLEFLGFLFRRQRPQPALSEAARFLDEHLLRWLPRFAERVAERCSTTYFAGLARLTGAYADELRTALEQALGQPRPSPAEIEQRMKPTPSCQADCPLTSTPVSGPTW